jgi:hypothetical protein
MAAGVTLPSPLRANRDSDKRSENYGTRPATGYRINLGGGDSLPVHLEEP